MAAPAVSALVTPCFYLFKSPLVVAPSFELWRKISSNIAKFYYVKFYESNFADENLYQGAKVGIFSCADAICRNDQARLNYLMTSTAVKYTRTRIDELPPDLISDKLSFKQENIVSVFTHSHLLSTERFLAFGEKSRPTFYATMVAFIDKNGTTPIPLIEAQKRLHDMLICNVTFARLLVPLGRWQISDVNFFDGKAIHYL